MRVEIEPDALEVDDATHLAPARPREVRVAVFGDAALLRATMLASKNDGVADRVARVAPSTVLASDARSADLVLDLAGDAGVGASASTWVLRVVPPATPTAWVGPFLVERHHPLLVGTTFDGVAWVGDESADLGGAPIVSAGFATLVSERTVYEGREIVLNTDLAAGTFTRSPDWPILLSNLVEWRRRALPGPRDVNLVVGQELWVGAPEGGTFVLEGPTGRVERSGTRELLFPAFELPGAYTLSRDGRRIADVGVGFLDATESDLRGLSSGSAGGGGAATARIAGGSSRSEWLLTLLALALVAADWWFLGRRGAR
ncbi:MAG: hypothetical protein R3F34_01825 [Planctomycetota bacterium]